MRNTLIELIKNYSGSRSQLARRAGVSASTVSRIVSGTLDPTLTVASSLLAAMGLQFPTHLMPLCDVAALHAGRRQLEGDPVESPWEQTLQRWASGGEELLAMEAGRAAPTRLRPEVVVVRTNWNVLRVLGAVAASGQEWAVSGWPAAMEPTAGMKGLPFPLYVAGGYGSLGLALPDQGQGDVEIHVLPFDSVSESGRYQEDGIWWAAPEQVLLDLFGQPGGENLARDYGALLRKDCR